MNINLNLDYMPKLQHFNLMEGLEEITINTSNMKSISVPTGVKKINFILSATPNLKYFNLMEGLEELILTSPTSITIPSLKIPSSVKTCSLEGINFNDLIFEGGVSDLKLVLTDCTVSNKIICERELTSDSDITSSILSTERILNYLSVDYSFLSKLSDTNTFGEILLIDTQGNPQFYSYSDFTTLFLTGTQQSRGAYPALKINLHFKVIHNLIGDNHYYYTGLSAGTWIE